MSNKKHEKKQNNVYSNIFWIYKRLTWETILTEKEIEDRYGKLIYDMALEKSVTDVCKFIRSIAIQGGAANGTSTKY